MSENTPAEKIKSAIGGSGVEDESALWSGKYSGKSMAGTWLLMAVITIVALLVMLIVSSLRTSSIAWYSFLGLLAVAWLVPLAVMTYRKFSRFYELTTQRLKHRDGILFRKTNRIELIDIDDVAYQQGPIESMLNVGTISIKSSDISHPDLKLIGIADVRTIADMIDDARRTERRKRGLHIEAI